MQFFGERALPMKYMLTFNAWGGTKGNIYFCQAHPALEAAHELLNSCCPIAVIVYESVEGQGYVKELLNQNNHVAIGLSENPS